MENITPAEAWSILLAAALAITTLAGAAEKIVKAYKTAKAPGDRQDARLDELEAWLPGKLIMLQKLMQSHGAEFRVNRRHLPRQRIYTR